MIKIKHNQNDSILKKKAIVDAVVKLMDEEGLKNVTIKNICDEANISVGAFYHYFSSKDSIIFEMHQLMDEYFVLNKKEIVKHITATEDIVDFVSHFGIYVEQWGYYANLLIMRTSIENLFDNKIQKRRDILKEIIQSGIEEKHLSVNLDAEELTSTIFVLIRGYLLEWIKKGHDYPITEKMIEHTKWLLYAIQNI